MTFQKGAVNPSSSAIKELATMNIELQKITVELIDKMNNLTTRMDRMLSLFEDAARTIGNTPEETSGLKTQLQDLLEQNKTIARGLLSIEKYIREKQPASLSAFQQKPGYP
ncbi:hypothetical protein J4208_01930 [Candidatus Woesearchaeota archaeon]|nr:hypothetical protein [Candidatus Woesearchaeota archaeon]